MNSGVASATYGGGATVSVSCGVEGIAMCRPILWGHPRLDGAIPLRVFQFGPLDWAPVNGIRSRRVMLRAVDLESYGYERVHVHIARGLIRAAYC